MPGEPLAHPHKPRDKKRPNPVVVPGCLPASAIAWTQSLVLPSRCLQLQVHAAPSVTHVCADRLGTARVGDAMCLLRLSKEPFNRRPPPQCSGRDAWPDGGAPAASGGDVRARSAGLRSHGDLRRLVRRRARPAGAPGSARQHECRSTDVSNSGVVPLLSRATGSNKVCRPLAVTRRDVPSLGRGC